VSCRVVSCRVVSCPCDKNISPRLTGQVGRDEYGGYTLVSQWCNYTTHIILYGTRWFFRKGLEVGMTSFEPDFMNQNYNCVRSSKRCGLYYVVSTT